MGSHRYEPRPPAALDKVALATNNQLIGETWDRYGEDTWMSVWGQVYKRKAGAKPDIVSELRSIEGREIKSSVELLLDEHENAGEAQAALAAVYDDPTMTEIAVYSIGDGAAMSGILIAGRQAIGETTCLIFLLD